MSIEKLNQQIEQFGVANAIVALSSEVSAAPDLEHLRDPRMIRRNKPEFVESSLVELSKLFQPGNIQLQTLLRNIGEADASLLPDLPCYTDGQPAMLHLPHLGIVYGAVTSDTLYKIEKHIAVKSIGSAPLTLEPIVPPTLGPIISIPAAEVTWGLERLRAPCVWSEGYTGCNILVGHLDSGAESEHPALKGAVVKNLVVGPCGINNNSENPYTDSDDHGTMTAGTLAGRPIASETQFGMAPEASLACATIMDGGDLVRRVLVGLDWVVSVDARIVNLSFGTSDDEHEFGVAIQALRDNQVLPVAAVGNEGPGSSRSPANLPLALSVGAVNAANGVTVRSSSEHSGTKSCPLLCAPGIEILSAYPGNEYREGSESSMATPHVSGLAALLLEAKPTALIDEIQEAIIESCENPANEDPKRIGAGIPNGISALDYLLT